MAGMSLNALPVLRCEWAEPMETGAVTQIRGEWLWR